MAPTGRAPRARALRPVTLIALLIALAASAVAAWGVHAVVTDQEHRLLKERANELNLVLTSAIAPLTTSLANQGALLQATHGSRDAYEESASAAVDQSAKTSSQPVSFAWVRQQKGGSGWVVVGAAGSALQRGQVITDQRARTFDRALRTPLMVPTPLIGNNRILGFALGPPAAPPDTVLYRESPLGPLRAPPQASTAPFAELDLVIYNSAKPAKGMALAATRTDLPLTGYVVNTPLKVGAETWDVSTRAKKPLTGGFAHDAWWVVLLIALFASLLIALVIETAARRRDDALAMYATEHEVAETLQRSLLPKLPTIDGLELAARYIAGGRGQEVGGDWYDAFPVDGDRVGIAVGDVIGHDLAAASAMAQIRAVLRAYAVGGDSPSSVINRLDHLIDALGLTQLVTVIYGVLDPPAADGSRRFTYANAGHLAPLVRRPGGDVQHLIGGESVVIGAPIEIQHGEGEQTFVAGTTLVLFTDGLVEVPGRPLDDTMQELCDTVAEISADESLEAVCDRILAMTEDRSLRDDIALLTIRLSAADRSVVAPRTPDATREPV
ncbi:MAG TPA: PP2C family protein-serine/threonine phosphatase [Mycobacteriales bacterium]|nr:PP2C family protein-serine/threonine phosphatase [Mycobacteriales bacterium]